jgi:hypothetical protein
VESKKEAVKASAVKAAASTSHLNSVKQTAAGNEPPRNGLTATPSLKANLLKAHKDWNDEKINQFLSGIRIV